MEEESIDMTISGIEQQIGVMQKLAEHIRSQGPEVLENDSFRQRLDSVRRYEAALSEVLNGRLGPRTVDNFYLVFSDLNRYLDS